MIVITNYTYSHTDTVHSLKKKNTQWQDHISMKEFTQMCLHQIKPFHKDKKLKQVELTDA